MLPSEGGTRAKLIDPALHARRRIMKGRGSPPTILLFPTGGTRR